MKRALARLITLVIFSACSVDPVPQAKRWAKDCGLADLHLERDKNARTGVIVLEPHEVGLRFSLPSSQEQKLIDRQARVESALTCMRPKAELAGVHLNYSNPVIIN